MDDRKLWYNIKKNIKRNCYLLIAFFIVFVALLPAILFQIIYRDLIDFGLLLSGFLIILFVLPIYSLIKRDSVYKKKLLLLDKENN